MAVVVSITRVRPAPRFDAVSFTVAVVQENVAGTWTTRDTFTFAADVDPTAPAEHSFTVTNAASDDNEFRIRFEDDDGNFSLTEPISLRGYPTTEELVSLSSVTELTGLTADQQDVLRDSTIAAVEEYCGQGFGYTTDETVVVDGQGANVLHLPKRLIALDTLLVNNYGMTVSSVVISERRDRLHFADWLGMNYYEQAIREMTHFRFPIGFGNVAITGSWGWEEFPEAVRAAIVFDMEDQARADANALSASVAAFRKLGIRSIDQGNLRADIEGSPGLSPRVQATLRPYVWHGTLGAVL